MNSRKKNKKPNLSNSYSIISMDSQVKSMDDYRIKETLLPIGTLVNVNKILDEKYAGIKVVYVNKSYSDCEEELWKCPRDVLVHVDKDVWPFIEAVQSPVEQVFELKNYSRLNNIVNLEIGSLVLVKEDTASTNLPALVKYIGPVPSKGPGTYFGVELLEGEGDNDGIIDRKVYFKCPVGTGMFVPINKIMLPNNSDNNSKLSSSSSSTYLHHNSDISRLNETTSPTDGRHAKGEDRISSSSDNNSVMLKPGDKVVWFSPDGPKFGKVLGYNYTNNSPSSYKKITVEFNKGSNLNNPYNYYREEETMSIPAQELIKYNDFYGITDNNVEVNSMKSSDYEFNLQASKSIDIVNNSKQSTYHHHEHPLNDKTNNDLIVFDTPPKHNDVTDIINNSRYSLNQKQIPAQIKTNHDLIMFDTPPKYNHTTDLNYSYKETYHQPLSHSLFNNDLILFDTSVNNNFQDGLSPEREEYDNLDGEVEDWDGETDLDVGSLVQVHIKGTPHYGVVRWIGTLPHQTSLIAGIEMDEVLDNLKDGTYNGHRYFTCNPGRAYFTSLSNCRSDSRFQNLDLPGPSSVYANSSSADYPMVESPVIRGSVAPISREEDLGELCGKYRGIQGHHNSCYLDATLFSMFTFTSVFDSLLLRPPDKEDIEEYSEVQRVLREEIVNPLRANLYVSSDRIMKLRTLLDRLSSVPGLTSEEKDPEEFLTSLVAQILRAEPFLKLSSGQEAYLYQLFLEKDESITFPTVQQLFDQSFLASDIKLKQVPSCLIIQMPRFGKSYKMYPRILPSQVLDVTDVIEHSPRQCTVCGRLAEYECKQCFNQCDAGLQSISFCASCLEKAHSHEKRSGHGKIRLTVPNEYFEYGNRCTIPRIYMSLFAVLCIETSHYVAFVKCGTGPEAPWCFFDSMADRKGEQDGYNIPEVVACPFLPEWLSERGAQTLNQITDEKQLPELAKRLLCDAYMCIYQSTDVMMYS